MSLSRINIFVAGSSQGNISKLKEEITSQINRNAQKYSNDYSYDVYITRCEEHNSQQDRYNADIENSSLVIFLIGDSVGEFTKAEYELAKKQQYVGEKKEIKVYFLADAEQDDTCKEFQEQLIRDNHYSKVVNPNEIIVRAVNDIDDYIKDFGKSANLDVIKRLIEEKKYVEADKLIDVSSIIENYNKTIKYAFDKKDFASECIEKLLLKIKILCLKQGLGEVIADRNKGIDNIFDFVIKAVFNHNTNLEVLSDYVAYLAANTLPGQKDFSVCFEEIDRIMQLINEESMQSKHRKFIAPDYKYREDKNLRFFMVYLFLAQAQYDNKNYKTAEYFNNKAITVIGNLCNQTLQQMHNVQAQNNDEYYKLVEELKGLQQMLITAKFNIAKIFMKEQKYTEATEQIKEILGDLDGNSKLEGYAILAECDIRQNLSISELKSYDEKVNKIIDNAKDESKESLRLRWNQLIAEKLYNICDESKGLTKYLIFEAWDRIRIKGFSIEKLFLYEKILDKVYEIDKGYYQEIIKEYESLIKEYESICDVVKADSIRLNFKLKIANIYKDKKYFKGALSIYNESIEKVNKLEKQRKTLEINLNTLEKQQKTLEIKLDTLEKRSKSIEKLDKLEKQLKNVGQNLEALDEQSKTLEEQPETVDEMLEALEEQPKSLEEQSNLIEEKDKLSKEIVKLSKEIVKLSKEKVKLKEIISEIKKPLEKVVNDKYDICIEMYNSSASVNNSAEIIYSYEYIKKECIKIVNDNSEYFSDEAKKNELYNVLININKKIIENSKDSSKILDSISKTIDYYIARICLSKYNYSYIEDFNAFIEKDALPILNRFAYDKEEKEEKEEKDALDIRHRIDNLVFRKK